MNRKPIFDAVKSMLQRSFTDSDVCALDAAIDEALGIEATRRTISAKGLSLIKVFEGLRLKAYPDPGTRSEPWTIGYGHTGSVKPGDVVTEAQAESLLIKDVARFEDAVSKLCPITTQGQFDALVSFAFNCGEIALKESTLRRLHNEGDYAGARDQFKRWSRAGGKVLAGLTRRRAAEAALYASES